MYSTRMFKFIENISEKLVRIVNNPSVLSTSFQCGTSRCDKGTQVYNKRQSQPLRILYSLMRHVSASSGKYDAKEII